MENIRSLRNVQCFRYLTSCMLTRLAYDSARVYMPATFYFIGDVLNFKEMRTRSEIGNEGAATRNALNVTLIVQLTQGAISRHTRNTFRFDQFVFGGHSIGWL